MSNNNNTKKNKGNGNSTSKSQKKGKRSAAAMARRSAKWASQKAAKKSAALAVRNKEREEEDRKVKSVLEMFPSVISIVGAQGFMPNVRKAAQTSKTMKKALNNTVLFGNADRATIYPGGQSVLSHYFERWNPDKVMETLNKGVPKRILDAPMPDTGSIPLQVAWHMRNLPIFKKLLEKGADPNQEFAVGGIPRTTLLHEVCISPSVESSRMPYLELLVKHKANLNKVDFRGYTPLDITIREHQNEIAKFLIDKGAKYEKPNEAGFTPLLTAIARSNVEMFSYMVEKGVDIDKKTGPAVLFPLKVAVLNGSLEMVQKVVDLKPKTLDAKDAKGNTPLHYAVMVKSFQKIRILSVAGANPNIRNDKGKTALQLAKEQEEKGNSRAYNLLK